MQTEPILCGGNVTGSENGIITSPNYPNYHYNATRFVCDWFISVKPGHKVMLHFDVFSVEGEPVTRGCSGAVVRVWTNPSISKPVELCGEKLANGSKEFVSEDNVLRLT